MLDSRILCGSYIAVLGSIPVDTVTPGAATMARKKTGPTKMQATETELRVVRLALPPEDHREFRKLAAAEETNMALLARRVIQEYIARQRKGGGK
jgi:hypothetical protein